jgi:FMN phosphatase YigB (HAD superfamily)
MKGAERLIRHFHHHKVPMAIAMNSERKAVEENFKLFGDFFTLFNHIVTVDEVLKGKFDPKIYKFSNPTHSSKMSCYFKDSLTGLKASKYAMCNDF